MSRYIDADSIRKAVEYIPWCEYDEVQKVIDEEPTADVAPVIHAKWIKVSEPADDEGLYRNEFFECSNCGYLEGVRHCYCPHCGYKMDLEDKE